MLFSDYLAAEWRPALGCTEPASIAFAAAAAAERAKGQLLRVSLVCDPRMYKNCYAVGIPQSSHKVGIRWAAAVGAQLPDSSLALESFRAIDEGVLSRAANLIDSGLVDVRVDCEQHSLLVDCRVLGSEGQGRAVIQGEHTRIVRLETDGVAEELSPCSSAQPLPTFRRELLAALSFSQLINFAKSLSEQDRQALRKGVDWNLAIARHGLRLFPERFTTRTVDAATAGAGRLVCAGVYARMWGEDFTVMSLAGSGNKGITCAVPIHLWGQVIGAEPARIDEALALACVITSLTTVHLGTLSAVCGCSNAAGIGLAAGLVFLEGGGEREISLAVNNMVGNVTGMVCDGAKIGCALKTMTAVDAAFRAANLALSGVGIPFSDGIVGEDGMHSLANLGRIATRGMTSVDSEILQIMQEKMN
jgi:L-cysteine desulfidase